MSKTIKLNDIDNDIFNVISNIKFYPRTEITNTHRGTVDDHIEMVICYKVDECKYYLTFFGYIITFGILFLMTYL